MPGAARPTPRRVARSVGAFALSALALIFVLGVAPRRVEGIPVFAHRFGLTCRQCHTVVPHLNAFGQAFLDRGYRLPAPIATARPILPIAVKVNLQYSSEPDPTGLPKGIVDEVELLSGGTVGPRLSYWLETYVIDGGRPGALRDAYVRYDLRRPVTADGDRAAATLRLAVGQFTLPLPVDPETFRETITHYAVYDQTVGENPFTFFDPHVGADLAWATGDGRAAVHVLALKSHDPQSGLPDDGLDRMLYAEGLPMAWLRLSAYRYDGSRPLGLVPDRFWRQGIGTAAILGPRGATELDLVLQNGFDSSADGAGAGQRSSGGFAQLRWTFTPVLFGIARYDGTTDPSGLHRSLTLSLSRSLSRNSRLTVEGVVTNDPAPHTIFDAALLFAY